MLVLPRVLRVQALWSMLEVGEEGVSGAAGTVTSKKKFYTRVTYEHKLYSSQIVELL